MPSPNIAYCRPEFSALLPKWNLIRDFIAGEDRVKARTTTYLPKPNPTDLSAENEARYSQYVLRALFYNATGRTQRGLVGQVMERDPEVEVPADLEGLLENVDGGGLTFKEHVSRTLAHAVAYGRAGLFVDFPRVEGVQTVADMEVKKLRPTVTLVDPWDIINWRTVTIGGVTKLSLVVTSEMYVTGDDGFEQKWDPQWRVLLLDEQGLYVIQEWIRDPSSGKDNPQYILKPIDGGGVAEFFPTDASGKRLDFIPFTFVGAANNDPTPDLPPLYDLAVVNGAHYRNSADYEESVYITGQPTPVFTGLTKEWADEVLKGVVVLGSRAAVLLPEGGAAQLLQASPNTLPKEAMDDKKALMVTLGARLVEQKQVQRTATEAGQDKATETCVLATIAKTVGRAYEQAFMFALRYARPGEATPEESQVRLNTRFTATVMDAQSRAQLIAEWQAGAITDEEMRGALQGAGIATEDIESWKDAREQAILNGNIVTPGQALEAQQQAKQDQANAKEKGKTQP